MFSFPQEIYFSKTTSYSLMLYGGKIKPREYDEITGYGIRVLKDGRVGFAYCAHENEIKKSLEKAAMASKFSPQSNFSFAPKATFPNVDIYDRKIANMDETELKNILEEVRNGAEKYSKNTKIIVSTSEEETRIENTNELEGEYSCTVLSIYAEVMDEDGFGFYSNAFTHLPQDYYSMGLHAAEMAREMRKPKRPDPGIYTVIMGPETLMDLLDILLPSFLGDWKRRGISILATKKGELFFNEKLSLYDDGTLSGTAGRPFDDEGVPARRRPLIEKGVVMNFIYDRETAFLEGIESDGYCNRIAFSTPPMPGNSNIEIATGNIENLEEEYNKENTLLIYALHGTHTANRTTGDFGVEINAGMLLGKEKRAVSGFMITGNIFNLFKDIKDIEKKRRSCGSFFSPRIAFGNVRVVS